MRKKYFFFAIICFFIANVSFAQHYDFSAVAPSGQTLYYKILNSTSVAVTYPGTASQQYSSSNIITGSLTIPSIVTNNSTSYTVTEIADSAFRACNMTGVTIPNTITRIGDYSFAGCFMGLTSSSDVNIVIPNSVVHLGAWAFYANYKLKSVVIGNSVTKINDNTFYSCTYLDTVIVGTSVDSIGQHAFFYCNNLEFILLPDSLQYIGYAAFQNCLNLNSIVIPDRVTTISSSAFFDCSGLDKVTIGKSLSGFSDNVFYGCSSIDTIVVRRSTPPTKWQYDYSNTLFFNVPNTAVILIPCGRTSRYQSSSTWSYFTNFVEMDLCVYDVNTTVNGSGSVVGSNNYIYGETAELTAIASNGYHFDHWQDGNTQNPRSFVVTQDTSFTAYFVSNSVTQYTITANSANSTMGTVNGGGTYNVNASVTLTATANSGYHFTQWQDGNTSNPRTITVTSNATYTAYFAVNDDPGIDSNNCIITEFPYTMDFDSDTNATCWEIDDINNDGVTWRLYSGWGYNNSRCAGINFADNASDALYSPWIATPGNYTITWKARVRQTNYPETYSVLLGSDTTLFSETLSSTSYVDRSATFTVTAGDTTYITFHYTSNDMYALFIDNIVISYNTPTPPTQYTLTVTSANTSMGSVTGGGTYNEGATATLTATANSGYHFTQWQDGNTSNPRTVTVTSNATYTAYFEANAPTQYTITVTSADPAMGNVTGGGTYNEGATATLTATANSGYHFTQWQDGNTNNPRTVTVAGNATYTAYFEQDATDPCAITTFPYNENFEGDLSCWTTIDGNSDGTTWSAGNLSDVSAHSGNTMLISVSWDNTPLHADEYLISPQIVLPFGVPVTLSWWFIVNGSYPEDKYAVLVSTTGSNVSDFTTTLVDITPTAANGNWTQRTLDLSSYAGQSIYIAFHHHDTYDQNYVAIDDLSITTTAAPTQYTVTVNSANPSMGSVSGGGTYNAGATATLTATANSGYHFVRWSDNNTQNPRNITVNSNITLTAYFAANAGIDDIDDAGIIVYAKDYQIHIDEAIGEEISIYSIDGRTVVSLPRATEHVAIPVTNTGVYIVKIGNHPARKVFVIR